MPLKHGPIEGLLAVDYLRDTSQFSMPLKHGPIEGRFDCCFAIVFRMFSMPLKHGPIEGIGSLFTRGIYDRVFHAPKAWPH